MSDLSIAALKKDAYEQIDKLSERSLALLVDFLKSVNGTNQPIQTKKKVRKPGIAEGKFVCPDDIDEDNDLIASWFEGK